MATPEIVGAAEVAEILGIGNTNFSHLRKQREGGDDAFPDPLVVLKCGPIWMKSDALNYAKNFTPGRRPSKTAGKPAVTKTAIKKVAAKKYTAVTKVAGKRKLSIVK
jgi:hypothetical protein